MGDNLVYFVLLALVAEVLGTVGGFGSSLFFVPIAGFFFDFHSVLGITALFHVSSNLSKIALFRKSVDRRIIIAMGVPAVLCVIVGALASKYVATRQLELALSVFLIVLSVVLLLKKDLKLAPTVGLSVAGGGISGFLAGLVGTGGAVRGIVLASFGLSAEVFIVTSAMIDMAIDSSRAVVYYFNGFVHKDDMYLIPILLAVSIAGTYGGKLLLKFIPEQWFRRVVLLLVLTTGIITLVKIYSK